MSATENVSIDAIVVGERLRPLDGAAVARIAESIKEIGLRTPITVRAIDGGMALVSGAHRLAAVGQLGWSRIEAFVIENWDEDEARRWEIAENLHRHDLTALQKDQQIVEWIRLTEKIAQAAPFSKVGAGRGNEGGDHLASRVLGFERTAIQRAKKTDKLKPSAMKFAEEIGMDDNRRAMHFAAKADTAERQKEILQAWKETPETTVTRLRQLKVESDVKERAAKEVAEIIAEYVPPAAWDGLKANLYAAGAVFVANALTNLTGQSIMDRQYGEAS